MKTLQKVRGSTPITMLVLGVVIPAGFLCVPEALIYAGYWRRPENWLAHSAVDGSFQISLLLGTLLMSTVLGSAFKGLAKSSSDGTIHALIFWKRFSML